MSRSAPLPRRAKLLATASVAVLALASVPTGAAIAAPSSKACDVRSTDSVSKLLSCVSANGVIGHLQEFQKIADANGGNRAAGLPGYDASAAYVQKVMKAAGWKVSTHTFDYTYNGPSTLTQLAPAPATHESESMTGTGYGTVEGIVIPVDVVLGQPNSTAVTSGCEPEDFAGLGFDAPGSQIALIQRGTCEFGVKAQNAQAAGAEAVIEFNQGNTPERSGVLLGTLFGVNTEPLEIPVVGASYAAGEALAAAGSTATVVTPEPEQRPQTNVIAELPGRNPNNVVMAGAHLDSVSAGPGINDNGSGSAALLEIAQKIGKLKPQNTVRFAWWGAEEDGLLGSQAWVDSRTQAELDKIALYLNFDMVASPNYIQMVYDADQSSWPAPVDVPAGSTAIEDLFERYYTALKVPYDDAEFSGRSDYEAFILAGIPSGGLFTGAEVVKTEEQAAIWGGVAGESYDQCYHQACDTIENIDKKALYTNLGAVGTAVLEFAGSTEAVNGVRGDRITVGDFLPKTPAGPELTVNNPGGGGLGHDHSHGPGDAS
ncbi:M28 family metallopeptidase [Agromyces seonyuensis]|uniref:M28 family peptidase n=1 Tax=Agromyces seonyuensis TaxID=2662446 RepID=A0A6I4NUU4_9MICO|nr:M28 family metallopeptidase [Agromyces seonyuensis]MWB98003.1 M28 family peptidase [Agromyces seonyuensis]